MEARELPGKPEQLQAYKLDLEIHGGQVVPDFVNVLLQAKEWNVAPWDLVNPESKGWEGWLVWMNLAAELMAHRKRVMAQRQAQGK